MKNKIILAIITLFTPLFSFAQEVKQSMPEPQVQAADNTIIYIALGILFLGLVAVFFLLSKQNAELAKKVSKLKKEVKEMSESTGYSHDSLNKKIKKIEDQLAELQAPQNFQEEIKIEEKSEKEEPIEVVVSQPEKPKEEIFYANYRPQDENFKLDADNDGGWAIWKITILSSSTEAFYELADVDTSKYGEQWDKIKGIVKTDTPPSGTIISARTIKKGKLHNADGYWRVDPDNLVEIEFECK
ncbi:MAG: TMF family protein [Dysgonomonas sp.]|nr:TMF family protein [Dysgonomonas sp.]